MEVCSGVQEIQSNGISMEEIDWFVIFFCVKKWFVYKGGQVMVFEFVSFMRIDVLEILVGLWVEVLLFRKIVCGVMRLIRIILW